MSKREYCHKMTRSTVDMRKRSIHELSKEFDAIEPSLMEVRPSNIAGRGLFTTVPLKKGSVLGEYTGRPIDSKPHSSDIGDYVMFTSRGPIDAYDDTLMRYVNHRTTKDGPNVITREMHTPKVAWVKYLVAHSKSSTLKKVAHSKSSMGKVAHSKK